MTPFSWVVPILVKFPEASILCVPPVEIVCPYIFLQEREGVPKSETFVVLGATNPPAIAFEGLRIIFPVVSPPIVNGLNAVVWIVLAPPAKVKLPEAEAFPAIVRSPVEVRLKLDEVTVRALAPSVNVDGAAPVKLSAPERVYGYNS